MGRSRLSPFFGLSFLFLILQLIDSCVFFNKIMVHMGSPFVIKHLVRRRTCCFRFQGRNFLSTKTSEPLRILFCGSDDFSCDSLKALYNEHRRNPYLIKSIDVLCRPGKPTGRSLKTIREGTCRSKTSNFRMLTIIVPIKAVSQELGLQIHERDTFTGWDASFRAN
jgi:hypothetical protein